MPTIAANLRQRGYSLIEVLVVLVILAIVAAVAVPMLGSTGATQLESAARLLAADIDYLRIQAITRGHEPGVFVVDTTNHQYHLAPVASPQTPWTHPVDGKPYRVRFGEGRAAALGDVRFHQVSFDINHRLRFGIYGQLEQPTSTASVTLTAHGRTLTLTIDPISGEVTIGQLN